MDNEKLLVTPKVDMEIELKKGQEVLKKKKFECKKEIPVSKLALCTAGFLAVVHGIVIILQLKSKSAPTPAETFVKKGTALKNGMCKKVKKFFCI